MRIAYYADEPLPKLRIVRPHTCQASDHLDWVIPRSVKYQARHNLDAIANDRQIAPRTIRSNTRLNTGIKLSYTQAHRTIKQVLLDLDGDAKEQFQLIGPMLAYIKQHGNLLEGERVT